ncbi:N-acetylglucosamine-6-phosphate deacetylase [Pseudoruegeria sp. SHC-113]|uniref:N-acetylglucosamine-6-phosphate deacetylase n=1 Tax=Pseudoruegeria sp. SHC-113 TaxID=2855439 RepID=UPI0021BA5BBC|nr:N-acetylglucosamine-6-phosphate deacetylase [Pseudoruegeria sp. SHC-113]MCT8161126.1 N-acetylglucosamine-6-phosphate deacetylase [Pseudoruegeria sp. SHC-113]
MAGRTLYCGGALFDGARLHPEAGLLIESGRVAAIGAGPETPADVMVDLQGDILCPGFADLQVNGGGGVMFNDAPTPETLATIAQAHMGLGAGVILPTLITDTPEQTRAAIAAAIEAVRGGVKGIGGLHLEGPHLSVARKGAHSAALIRPMEAEDLAALLAAAEALPALMVTVAPENVTPDQVSALAGAGVIVSLGHTDTDYDTAMAYQEAGAACVTHLFNAMSQMGNRAPGVVGAALDNSGLAAGLIADGIHVHRASIRAAWAAKQGPAPIFLVSDAMSPAGTDQARFTLNGREIRREAGRLTLADGTLAGADLDLTTAIGVLHRAVGVPLADALRAATSAPADVAGLAEACRIRVGEPDPVLRVAADFSGCSWVLAP